MPRGNRLKADDIMRIQYYLDRYPFYSRRKLAAITGTSQQTVRRIANGEIYVEEDGTVIKAVAESNKVRAQKQAEDKAAPVVLAAANAHPPEMVNYSQAQNTAPIGQHTAVALLNEVKEMRAALTDAKLLLERIAEAWK